jgi:hypothetical protein
MKVYIAGPITGIFEYKQRFKEAEEKVKGMGHITINPSFLPDGLSNYMGICYAMIDQADAIYLIDGWKKSKGAKLELEHAYLMGKQVLYES